MVRKRVLFQSGYAMMKVEDLPAVVALKLREGWFRELADVVRLIAAFNLDEHFFPMLPKEHHAKFLELLEEKRRDDEWHERNM
jgi:hypothetical protein